MTEKQMMRNWPQWKRDVWKTIQLEDARRQSRPDVDHLDICKEKRILKAIRKLRGG